MGIYIILLCVIISSSLIMFSQNKGKEKTKNYFLTITFISIFLLYSLRASSVGRDVPGYEKAYMVAATKAWDDYSYVYFENGYIFLMKICNYIGMSFQQFLTTVNVFILLPIFFFFKKYSNHVYLSVMTYVCYMFFEFNLTGIRQAIATSIVLIGIMALLGSKKYGILKYIFWVYIATLFHTGAFIGFFYVPFHFIKKQKIYIPIISVMTMFFLVGRGPILALVKSVFGKKSMNASAGLYIGLNFIFLIGLAILFVVANRNEQKILNKSKKKYGENSSKYIAQYEYNENSSVFIKMFLLSIMALILFGSDTSVRSYMILNQVILVQLPNCIDYLFTKESIKIAIIGLSTFLILFFFSNSLIGGGFDIVPYKFFWN